MLADHQAIEGDWLVALEQHSGRGRQGRTWVSAAGNFFSSTLVTPRPADPPAQTLSLAAGLALADAIELAAPDHRVMLKWPNDVLLGGRKLAGILLERSGDRIAIGFGVNLASAPDLADRPIASLDGALTPQAFAPTLAGSFARLIDLWRISQPALFAQAWLARAHPLGTQLTVHSTGQESITGQFDGIELDGALRLRRPDGALEIIRAGDVML